MPVLPLPLSAYDDAGVIKPPRWLYWLLALNCLDWLMLVMALASTRHTTQLLSLFYPQQTLLWAKLAATVPLIVALLLLGNRSRLWKKQRYGWCKLLLPLIVAGVMANGVVIVSQLAQLHWQFSGVLAGQLSLASLLLVLVVRSRHWRLLVKDWQQPA